MPNTTPTHTQAENLAQPPTPLIRDWIRLILGFGIGVAIGLAPYLGKVRVPGFEALLTLVPDSLQPVTIPTSAALMGIVAVWVQWTATENPTRTWIRKRFRVALQLTIVGLILLFVAQTFVVIRIPIESEGRIGSYLIGFSRLPTSPCPPNMPDAQCLERITLDDAAIATVWGDNQLRLAGLLLLGSYFVTTASFGMLIGLLLVHGARDQSRAHARQRAGRHARVSRDE